MRVLLPEKTVEAAGVGYVLQVPKRTAGAARIADASFRGYRFRLIVERGPELIQEGGNADRDRCWRTGSPERFSIALAFASAGGGS